LSVESQLEAVNVSVDFGGLKALDNVSLSLHRGEILGLIGPNGAGKTTLVNVLSGFQRPSDGKVILADTNVTRWSPEQRARRGLARTFQSVRLFRGLRVLENVELGGVGVGVSRREARRAAWDLLARVQLTSRASQRADSLPHGEERRLGIIRALAMKPRFLLLDEPAAGLNEIECDELIEVLAGIPADYGCGVLVIEHDMRLIMNLCQRIQVLDYGKTISIGTPSDVRADPVVLTAYLGTKRNARDAQG
jgi:branched-chain amino acid transport system ATP-binding protein